MKSRDAKDNIRCEILWKIIKELQIDVQKGLENKRSYERKYEEKLWKESIICEPSSCNVETLTMERFLLSNDWLTMD